MFQKVYIDVVKVSVLFHIHLQEVENSVDKLLKFASKLKQTKEPLGEEFKTEIKRRLTNSIDSIRDLLD